MTELARLSGLAALLLSFGMLSGGRLGSLAYVAQAGAVACAALAQAAVQADAGLVAVAAILVVQTALVWLNRPALQPRGPFSVAAQCAGLLLVVLATASTPSDGMGVPLAIVLLGLLGAASLPGPYGVLSLLNGAGLGMAAVPGVPLRPVLALALAALACIVVTDGGRIAWVRR